jgi:hypothetical protein
LVLCAAAGCAVAASAVAKAPARASELTARVFAVMDDAPSAAAVDASLFA